MKIAPSILSADFSKLKEEIQSVYTAEWLHIDVMDGHFVPNLTIGPPVIAAVRPHSKQIFDTHLMITTPEKYFDAFIDAGSDQITFHIETVEDPLATIRELHDKKVKAGVALKPNTSVETLIPLLSSVDLVLVMSVEPGFGGQTFMRKSLDKIRFLSEYRTKHNLTYDIVVDGGINEQTALECKKAGATVLVAGSFVFKQKNREAALKELRQ